VIAGCGTPFAEVSGKATVEGKPLTKAGVFFSPDKDNRVTEVPRGWLDADGKFHIQTADKKGCPPGWYKVYLTIERKRGEIVQSPVNAKYLDPAKTDISVEVVANPQPGAYDFDFKK
jgi:hypothetical protein